MVQLLTTYSLELLQDVRAMHSIDIETEILKYIQDDDKLPMIITIEEIE